MQPDGSEGEEECTGCTSGPQHAAPCTRVASQRTCAPHGAPLGVRARVWGRCPHSAIAIHSTARTCVQHCMPGRGGWCTRPVPQARHGTPRRDNRHRNARHTRKTTRGCATPPRLPYRARSIQSALHYDTSDERRGRGGQGPAARTHRRPRERPLKLTPSTQQRRTRSPTATAPTPHPTPPTPCTGCKRARLLSCK